ncbi:MAG: DinB family protein [Chloroflexota bacterium]
MIADTFLLELTPEPTLDVAPSVILMRDALAAATTDLLAIPDSALETGWPWREDEADVRYGLYRTIEAVEASTVATTRILRDTGARRTAGADRIAPTAIAQWELQGLLATLDDSVLDRHSGNGEWTPRQVLGHIVSGHRASGWFTAWWAARPADEALPDRIPEAVIRASGLPDEETEGAGTLTEIRVRLAAVADLIAGRLAHLDDADLALPARWASFPVTVGFRLGRWSSHLVEHTIQLDKTLVRLGRQPSEVDRLVRRLHGTYGHLEAVVHPMPAGLLAIVDARGCSVNRILGELAAELTADARSARAATGTV